ncbi:MAG: hypothetical protein P8N02_12900 [Actinomycetota bacterium]|nr:hypothetical protein [Actinomycetota bacterium]
MAALLLTSFALGLRHGIDWDHIAAIADLSGAAVDRRRGFLLSMLYAVGHGLVVLVLGVLLIVFGASIPSGADGWMGRLAGITLVALGVWVLIDLARSGRNFRLRSRWVVVLEGTFAGLRRVRGSGRYIVVEHEHPHTHDGAHGHQHPEAPELVATAGGARAATRRRLSHRHSHRHETLLPERVGGPATGTAFGVGLIHGVGIESPTQIAVFVASTAVVGQAAAVSLLFTWVAGLLLANAGLAAVAGAGLLHAERHFAAYVGVAVAVAALSIAVGGLLLLGLDVLPGVLS